MAICDYSIFSHELLENLIGFFVAAKKENIIVKA